MYIILRENLPSGAVADLSITINAEMSLTIMGPRDVAFSETPKIDPPQTADPRCNWWLTGNFLLNVSCE